ncbi:terpenoid cyclases/protein prenyltransferase alpha-alpha toroid [Immersiella caudata]|uniref:Terpenoid cyclases/protein prenyltransferase alpha-alpha toroid n=1 Tax=Immersiella caudata TaxID=314043 RepID=A0AA39U4P5_9PEZI|nr:terpenoid cyclases/protein prenyltransferase alpha-alpha toroid [Immersiella caudata]
MADDGRPSLDIERHLRYWKMCLRSPLPSLYLSNEGNRMALAYFIINAINILTPHVPTAQLGSDIQPPKPLITPEDRANLRKWVLSHQHPGGGFSGSISLVFPLGEYDEWDFETGSRSLEQSGLANIAATLFALQLLALLADDESADQAFKGVDRERTLEWLKRLQREDGSFGEALRRLPTKGWFIAGGYDMRYCYIAAAIRWILRGDVEKGDTRWVEDIDVEGFVGYIRRSQTYDGGFAGSSSEEPHAGYAYCAVGALYLLDRPLEGSGAFHGSQILSSGIRDMPGLIHWLSSRQFIYIEPSRTDDRDSDEEDAVNFTLPASLSSLTLAENQCLVGVNGRCNKAADTCYSWWVGASLVTLDNEDLISREPSRRFLLEKMQHRIGGFGKTPGSPPDLYHACFGLASLGVLGEPGLNRVDSSLAVPVETVKRIERARRELLRGAIDGSGAATLLRGGVDMGVGLRGGKPDWLTADNR